MITLTSYIKEGGTREAYLEPEAIVGVMPTQIAAHGSVILLHGGSQLKVSEMPDVVKKLKINAKKQA